jgi:hypothetical protein
VAGFNRNQWPVCVGTGGRIGSEYAGMCKKLRKDAVVGDSITQTCLFAHVQRVNCYGLEIDMCIVIVIILSRNKNEKNNENEENEIA